MIGRKASGTIAGAVNRGRQAIGASDTAKVLCKVQMGIGSKTHNKSLQLSPKMRPGSADAACQFHEVSGLMRRGN